MQLKRSNWFVRWALFFGDDYSTRMHWKGEAYPPISLCNLFLRWVLTTVIALAVTVFVGMVGYKLIMGTYWLNAVVIALVVLGTLVCGGSLVWGGLKTHEVVTTSTKPLFIALRATKSKVCPLVELTDD